MKLGIVTDSLSNLPPNIAKEYDITVIPGMVYVDNQKYVSGVDITTKEILNIIGKKNLKTAIPSPGVYFKTYEKMIDEFDLIISLHCPTKQTAFLKSAKLGAKRTKSPEKIHHIECGVATLGLGIVAISTAILAKNTNTMDIDAFIEKIEEYCRKVEVIGVVNSFEYIRRSGRVKLKLAGTLASVLSIKPVLAMHGTEIYLLDRPRSREKALDKLLFHFNKRFDNDYEPKMIGLGQLDCINDAKKIEISITSRYPIHKVITTDIDPMIASNTGPGLMLVTYFAKSNF